MASALLNMIPVPLLAAAVLLFVLTTAYVVGRRFTSSARAERPRCRRCLYQLHDDAAVCSECGSNLDRVGVISAGRVRPVPRPARLAAWSTAWIGVSLMLVPIAAEIGPHSMERSWQSRWRGFESGAFNSILLRRSIRGLAPLTAGRAEPTVGSLTVSTADGRTSRRRIDLSTDPPRLLGADAPEQQDNDEDLALDEALSAWLTDLVPDAPREQVTVEAGALAEEIARIEVPGTDRSDDWAAERARWLHSPTRFLSPDISLQYTDRPDDAPFERRDDMTRVRIAETDVGLMGGLSLAAVGWLVGAVLAIRPILKRS